MGTESHNREDKVSKIDSNAPTNNLHKITFRKISVKQQQIKVTRIQRGDAMTNTNTDMTFKCKMK